MRVAWESALASISAALRSASNGFSAPRPRFVLGLVRQHLALRGHAFEHRFGHFFGQLDFLKPEELDIQAVIVRTNLGLNRGENLVPMAMKFGAVIGGGNKVGEGCLPTIRVTAFASSRSSTLSASAIGWLVRRISGRTPPGR